jgi:hypothetical protein
VKNDPPPADAAASLPEHGDTLPDPNDPASFEPTYGERTTVDALYRIDPIRGGKELQAVHLITANASYVHAYRPLRSELKFAEKRVRVTGRPFTHSPYVQAVGGEHFDVESIELAPGETPWDPEPTTLPTPAQARSATDAKALSGWYAACHGTLDGQTFTFSDGSTLPATEVSTHYPIEGIGQPMTMLAYVQASGTLVPRAGCPGDVPRCGVYDEGISE